MQRTTPIKFSCKQNVICTHRQECTKLFLRADYELCIGRCIWKVVHIINYVHNINLLVLTSVYFYFLNFTGIFLRQYSTLNWYWIRIYKKLEVYSWANISQLDHVSQNFRRFTTKTVWIVCSDDDNDDDELHCV